jgi:hypothetical protein
VDGADPGYPSGWLVAARADGTSWRTMGIGPEVCVRRGSGGAAPEVVWADPGYPSGWLFAARADDTSWRSLGIEPEVWVRCGDDEEGPWTEGNRTVGVLTADEAS